MLGAARTACRSISCPVPDWILLSMVGVALACGQHPLDALRDFSPVPCRPKKCGLYMGSFNFFIVLPQLLAGIDPLGFWSEAALRPVRPCSPDARRRFPWIIAAVMTLFVERCRRPGQARSQGGLRQFGDLRTARRFWFFWAGWDVASAPGRASLPVDCRKGDRLRRFRTGETASSSGRGSSKRQKRRVQALLEDGWFAGQRSASRKTRGRPPQGRRA